ncbi:MAG: restriction endonuclease subunit S [Desulfovibrio sp.]|jgi:type I restriction enzyme S subunit|nr:restriction endonuclease subunit S [Desulfovibrio sp.]
MWPVVKLGEVLTERREVPSTDDLVTGRVRIVSKISFNAGQIEFRPDAKTNTEMILAYPGDLLISGINAAKGAIAVYGLENTYPAAATIHYSAYTPDLKRTDAGYLWWFLRSRDFQVLLERHVPGGIKTELKAKRFLPIPIPLPPLPEQRRIVARIEVLAAQINEVRELRRQATEEVERLIVSEEFTIWPQKNLQHAIHLEEISTFLARGKQSERGDSNHFLIKTQHVQQDKYIQTFLRLAPHAANKVKTDAIVQDGDILIACSAAGCLGRVARYRDDGRIASTDTHVAVLRPNNKLIDPDYLYAYLRGAQGQYQLRSRERGDWQREKIGFRLTELNLKDLRKVPVPVPSLPEQHHIVAELDALQAEVDALKRLQAETAADLDALLPAVLDLAFKGEL